MGSAIALIRSSQSTPSCQSEFFPQRPLRRQTREHESEEVRAVPQRILDEAALFLAVLGEARGQRVELIEREKLPARRDRQTAEYAIVARQVGHLRLQVRGNDERQFDRF